MDKVSGKTILKKNKVESFTLPVVETLSVGSKQDDTDTNKSTWTTGLREQEPEQTLRICGLTAFSRDARNIH